MFDAIIVVLLYIKRDTDKKTFYCNHRLAKVEVEVVASKSHTLVTLLYSDPVWSLLALVGSFSIFQVNIPCRPFSVYERVVLYSLIVSSILCDTDSVEAKPYSCQIGIRANNKGNRRVIQRYVQTQRLQLLNVEVKDEG